MTATSRRAAVTLPTDEQILITRDFDAPAALAYRAWTEPELVRQWWSGRRGSMTTCEIDLRVGGSWRYVMVADGGFEVAFHGELPRAGPGRAHRPHRGVRGRPRAARRGDRDVHRSATG